MLAGGGLAVPLSFADVGCAPSRWPLPARLASAFGSHFPPGCGRLCINCSQTDVFDFEVFLQAFGPALATEARLLDAAERHDLVGEDAFVDADHAGVELLGNAPAPTPVLAAR